MDNYVTGQTIKRLRDGKGITQSELAEQLGVSDKAVSKWETKTTAFLSNLSRMNSISRWHIL